MWTACGARLPGARPHLCQRLPAVEDEGGIAAQRASPRRGPADDKVEPSAIVGWHSRCGRSQQPRAGAGEGVVPVLVHLLSPAAPQPGLGLQPFGRRGRADRKWRRNASCMACGERVSAGSLGIPTWRVDPAHPQCQPSRGSLHARLGESDESGVDPELVSMPKREPIANDFSAPCIVHRNINKRTLSATRAAKGGWGAPINLPGADGMPVPPGTVWHRSLGPLGT